MNFWFDVFVELPVECEDDEGRMHPKGRRYTDCNTYEEIVEKIKEDHATLDQAFIVFYNQPKDEAIDVTWKVRSIMECA